MQDLLTIYLDRLHQGESETFQGPLDPSFLECKETELCFDAPVEIEGKAYIANDHLVISAHAKTTAKMPCIICNEMIFVPIEVTHFYHTKALEDCSSSTYHFAPALRDQILLELPRYVECEGGCKERDSVKRFIKNSSSEKEDTHFPFSGLEQLENLGD